MRATILPKVIILLRPVGLWSGQYNRQGVYCGLSTASEVFLTFTTQQCSKLRVHPAPYVHILAAGSMDF